MPFINGRYHLNPAMGHALEDARQAAEELLASDDAAHSSPDDDFAAPSRESSSANSGPIHHIEIESAEVVPSSTGRATHGFVARVHRVAPLGGAKQEPPSRRMDRAPEAPARGAREIVEPGGSVASQRQSSPLRPETHVFTDHRDLLDFLRDELEKDCSRP